MKILVVSDMHGNLEIVERLLETLQPELLLCCGDWGDPGELDYEIVTRIIRRIHTLTVYGNHDDLDFFSSLTNTDGTPVLLNNGVVIDYKGITISGINGIWAKSHNKPFYILDEEVLEAANRISGTDVDILLSHGCPIGLADLTPAQTHGGQKCFMDAEKLIKPAIYLCGHLHVQSVRRFTDGRAAVNTGYTCAGDYIIVEGRHGIPPPDWKIQLLRLE